MQLLQVYYDGDCELCSRWIDKIFANLNLPRSWAKPAQSSPNLLAEMERLNSWIVIDANGQHHHRADALAALLAASPRGKTLAKLLRILPIRMAGNAAYRVFARHRGLLR